VLKMNFACRQVGIELISLSSRLPLSRWLVISHDNAFLIIIISVPLCILQRSLRSPRKIH